MSFKNQHHRYKRRIDKLWAPVSIEVMLQDGPEKKISVLKKAQQQAAKEILHLEEASAFIEFLESEIKKYQDELNNNDPNSTSQSAQSNEMLNTGKRTIEGIKSDSKKIQWIGTLEELRSLFDLLYESGLLAEGSDIPTLAQNHFYISGNKPIDNKSFAKVKRLKKGVSKQTTEQFLEFLREEEELE